ncbi:MAG: ATP-grasp domain-containing protein [Planctomycetia bacterium]|nr:ATP-grasp domain-containing protein [Planctomycetia bacterium]
MKALVLAGGIPQAALIQELKSRGITTILADRNPEALARPYADKFYPVSTMDVEAVKNLAIQEQVDFLITVCADQVLLVVAKLSEELGLPCYIDYQTAKNCSDKSYMKEIFARYEIPTAKFITVKEINASELAGLRYPLVVKPVDSYSSRGVRRVENFQELQSAFADALRIGRADYAMIEEFIEGEELTVDVYVEEGRAHVLNISNSDKIAEADKFVICRTRNPAPITEVVREKVARVCQQIADAFGLKNSPMLVQMIADDKDVSVLEFCARTGGAIKFILIRKACGFDVVKAVVDLTLGQRPHVELQPSVSPLIMNDYLYCKPGIFEKLEGFEELKIEGYLADYYQFKNPGAEFTTVASSGDRVAAYTIHAQSLEDLVAKHNVVRNRVKALDVNGEDLIRHDLIADIEWK